MTKKTEDMTQRSLDKMEHSNNFSKSGENKLSSWRLSDDAELCSFLSKFSSHVCSQKASLSKSVSKLERKIDNVTSMVDKLSLNMLMTSDSYPMKYTFSESQTMRIEKYEEEQISYSEDTMRREEESAVHKGIMALSIFHDSVDPHDYTSDHFFGLEEEDIISSHYYESSQEDIFNQRPLPFTIGTEEFFISDDAGIGEST